jgi:enoyl-CoA hydratase/carnithine racemase
MPAVLTEVRDFIAIVTLNRPAIHNVVNPEMLCRLADAWRELDADRDVRVVILTGAGDNAFSVGADLGRLTPLLTGARPPDDEWDRRFLAESQLNDTAMLRGEFVFSKPVIAAIKGYCYAGAMELMTATHIRVASDTASFALQETKWALAPTRGSLARLPDQIPYCKVMELFLTARPIDAHEALRWGLVNYVVPPNEVMAKAVELAGFIAANGPLAIRRTIEGVRRCVGRTLPERYQIEDEIFVELNASEDAREGPRAFLEKRKPRYKGI